MRPLGVVEAEGGIESGLGLPSAGVGLQVYLFVLHRSPQPFYEDVVQVPPFPVHADSDSVAHQETGEAIAGELAPLVCVKDNWLSFAQSFFQGFDTKVGIQGVGQIPGHHVPAMPIHDRHQVQKASGHRHVGNVGRPHPVGLGDFHASQQVGIHLVPWSGASGRRQSVP